MPEALGHARDGSTFPIHSCAQRLPAHDRGTAATVRMMTEKATGAEGAQHPQVRDFALQATANCRDRDDWQQAQALYRAVKNKIRFRGEFGETVQTPVLTLKWQAGDCDDFTTLLCALCQSIGIPSRIQTVALHGRDFAHVFAVAGIRQRGQVVDWRALDATVPHTEAGWQPRNVTRRKFWGGDELGCSRTFTAPLAREANTMPQGNELGFLGIGKIFHVVTGAVKGFATGGPTGAITGGAKATVGEVMAAKAKTAARRARQAAILQQHGMTRAPHPAQVAFLKQNHMAGYGMSGYIPGPIPMRTYSREPLAPLLNRAPGFPGNGGRVYLGDAGGITFFDSWTTTQKAVGGVVALGVVLALTQ